MRRVSRTLEGIRFDDWLLREPVPFSTGICPALIIAAIFWAGSVWNVRSAYASLLSKPRYITEYRTQPCREWNMGPNEAVSAMEEAMLQTYPSFRRLCGGNRVAPYVPLLVLHS